MKDTVALVTGASRGIGKAIALRLAESGAEIAVNYLHSQEQAEGVVAIIRGNGGRAFAVQADISELEQVKKMCGTIKDELGPVDVLVNNAGITSDNLVTFMSEEEWDKVIDTSLKGAFLCTKIIGRTMARRKTGRIVNISSDAALLGDMMRSNYAAAKAGMLGLTKTAAREFSGYGITVNAVAPGVIETDLIEGMSEPKREKQKDMIPMKRFGTAEEVAEVVAFLVSGEASYITGQTISVDGGLCMS